MIKTGILGGTFLPFHKGHLSMAETAYCEAGLDEVWILPNGTPPYKTLEDEIPAESRIRMIELLIGDLPGLSVNPRECNAPRFKYTYETMTKLSQEYPNREFWFIMGEDSIDYFDEWRHPEIITGHARIIVCIRSEEDFGSLREKCRAKEQRYHQTFLPVHMKHVPISSTEIRERLKKLRFSERQMLMENEKACEELAGSLYISKEELRYILSHRLFEGNEDTMQMSVEEIEKDLKKRLKPSRYQHTMGVMYTSAALAMCYQYPMEKALYAGLLHDCAKYMSGSELLEFSEKHEIPVTDAERESPQLLHAKVGAYYAEHRYGVTDPEILHAIRVHTTGVPNMSLLDKILFISDYIEPGRDKAAHLPEIRSHAFRNLDETVEKILRDTLDYLASENQAIDETTESTYEFYRRREKQ